jgi:hypothetical protein
LIVEKVFGANRQGARNSGLELLMLFIELEASDAVLNAVIHGLDHKTPKHVVLAVFTLKEAVR